MNFHQQLELLRETIKKSSLTPERAEITLKTKLNSVQFKPLFSNGGVESLPGSRYNILLNDILTREEIKKVFVHELIHVHYSETHPEIKNPEEYKSVEALIEPEALRFLEAYPDYISQLEQEYLSR